MAEEVDENIKVVVRVRDLIARERDQPKVRHLFDKEPDSIVNCILMTGVYGGGRHRNYPEIHK